MDARGEAQDASRRPGCQPRPGPGHGAPLPRAPGTAPTKRAIQIVSLVLFLYLMAAILIRVAGLVQGLESIPVLLLGAASGLLFTDLVSAVVHWFCDTYLEEDTPILGRALILPFREHHREPLAMKRRGALEVNTSNAVAVIPCLALGLWIGPPHTLLGQSWLFFFGLAVYATNTVHQWAHVEKPPCTVRWLQRSRVLLHPDHHGRHHARTCRAYAITTGWLSPLLDRMRLFERIEAGVELLCGRARGEARRA